MSLIGPIEPTGLSWLINCLIELNIQCSMDSETWAKSENGFELNSSKYHLRRWLPSLSDTNRAFKFRDDIEIFWSHDWINSKHRNNKAIFFSRNPKTALYSGYKRMGAPNYSFLEYLRMIDSQWLLNRMQIWNLFHFTWSLHRNIKFFYFEDYKENPKETLIQVIKWIEIEGISDSEIEVALAKSTWEAARKSEEDYLLEHGISEPKMIRSGSISIEDETLEIEAYELIAQTCDTLFSHIKNESIDKFAIKDTLLELHTNDFLRTGGQRKVLIDHEFINKERISGIYEITQESFELAARNNQSNHLMSALRKKIIYNFISDILFLIRIKYDVRMQGKVEAIYYFLKFTLSGAFGIVFSRMQNLRYSRISSKFWTFIKNPPVG